MGRWLDRLANRPVNVTVRHDQAGRAVTNQSGHEQTESQIRPRPLSMDGDRFRNGMQSALGDLLKKLRFEPMSILGTPVISYGPRTRRSF